MVKVSVIVPIYNVETYIARCIQSVMDQIYDGPMECLLVDDCGADNSMTIVEQMISEYKGPIDFKVLHHEHNRGLSAARNTGTDAATGDFIYYLDSDDAMTPDCISLMAAEVEKHPAVEMVMGAHEIICEDATKRVVLAGTEAGYMDDNKWIRYQFFKEEAGLKVTAWNRLVLLGFIKGNGLRFMEGVIHEDEHWSFYVYQKLKRLTVIKDVTYLHFVTSNSIMTTNTAKKRAEAMFPIVSDWIDDFSEPCRALQVFRSLEYFRFHVLPYVPKKKAKRLYFSFFRELMKIGEFKIAFYWWINWFRDFRHSQLYYKMIPEAHRKASGRLKITLN